MTHTHDRHHRRLAVLAALLLSVGGGCSSLTDRANAGKSPENIASVDNKTGAELWAENCMRCHNLRSPADFTPAQWAVVASEMRQRANLTAVEHQRILEFLQAASR
jgi:hypothetical protein